MDATRIVAISPPSPLGFTTMVLAFITAWLKSEPRYVWKPAVTLTDPRIVSELTDALN